MLDLQVQPSGDLCLRLDRPLRDSKAWVREVMANAVHLDHDVLSSLLEGHEANGIYYAVRPGDGESGPFVGLTDAPCITDYLDIDDKGFQTVKGALWTFHTYQTTSFAECLLKKGFVHFSRVPDESE